jgi:polar amino acid transport system substrate-binding protein
MVRRAGNASARDRRSKLGAAVLAALCLWAGAGEGIAYADSHSALDAVKKRGVVRAGIRFDNPPHSFIDNQGRWVGFDVDIAEAIAKQLGVRLEKVKVDELTRISYLKTGQIDMAVASMSHTVRRDMEVDFSITYFCSKQTFLVKKGEIGSLADLVGKPAGMSRGSHSITNWRAWLKRRGHPADARIVEFTSKQAAVEAVRQGAIAGWAEDYEVVASFARQDPSLAVLADEGIGAKQDGVGVRENDSKWRDAINFALRGIAMSGEYETIYARWFGPSSETPVPPQCEIEVWPE